MRTNRVAAAAMLRPRGAAHVAPATSPRPPPRTTLWVRALVLGAVYVFAFIHGSTWSAARVGKGRAAPAHGSNAAEDVIACMLVDEDARSALRARLARCAPARELPAAPAEAAEPAQPGGRRARVPRASDIAPREPVRSPANGSESGGEKRVISYSLYGAKPKYVGGALQNAELVGRVFPGWVARFYVDARTVPADVLRGLARRGAEVVEVDTARLRDQHMFWRFWVAADPAVDRFICRDVDSRLLERDAAAVREWTQSGAPFHIERDHPSHSNYPISGGLWGGTKQAAPDMLELIGRFPTDANYLSDMNFLNERVWPRAEGRSLQHDAFSCDRFGARPFPMARSAQGEHVGQVFEEDGKPRAEDVRLLLEAAAPPECRHPDDAPTPGNSRADRSARSRPGRAPPRPAADRARAERSCVEMRERYGVIPRASWGTAPRAQQANWTSLSCDAVLDDLQRQRSAERLGRASGGEAVGAAARARRVQEAAPESDAPDGSGGDEGEEGQAGVDDADADDEDFNLDGSSDGDDSEAEDEDEGEDDDDVDDEADGDADEAEGLEER